MAIDGDVAEFQAMEQEMRHFLLQLACGVRLRDIIRRAWGRSHARRMDMNLKDMKCDRRKFSKSAGAGGDPTVSPDQPVQRS